MTFRLFEDSSWYLYLYGNRKYHGLGIHVSCVRDFQLDIDLWWGRVGLARFHHLNAYQVKHRYWVLWGRNVPGHSAEDYLESRIKKELPS